MIPDKVAGLVTRHWEQRLDREAEKLEELARERRAEVRRIVGENRELVRRAGAVVTYNDRCLLKLITLRVWRLSGELARRLTWKVAGALHGRTTTATADQTSGLE
jgi:hypothetical protein